MTLVSFSQECREIYARFTPFGKKGRIMRPRDGRPEAPSDPFHCWLMFSGCATSPLSDRFVLKVLKDPARSGALRTSGYEGMLLIRHRFCPFLTRFD